jgi:hypothetical protein
MVLRRKLTDAELEDEEFEEEYESLFNKASNESDNSLLFMGGLIGLVGLTSAIGNLSSEQLEALEAETGTVAGESVSFEIPGIGDVTEFIPGAEDAILEIQHAENLAPEELSHLTQMMEDAKQYGRMSDPKTAENLTFNNQSTIAEKMGMFGSVEAEKQGRLQCYADQPVLIQWVDAGDDAVCEDCQELAARGPYRPEDYPEAPHYGCRCGPGDPILDLSNATLPDI